MNFGKFYRQQSFRQQIWRWTPEESRIQDFLAAREVDKSNAETAYVYHAEAMLRKAGKVQRSFVFSWRRRRGEGNKTLKKSLG